MFVPPYKLSIMLQTLSEDISILRGIRQDLEDYANLPDFISRLDKLLTTYVCQECGYIGVPGTLGDYQSSNERISLSFALHRITYSLRYMELNPTDYIELEGFVSKLDHVIDMYICNDSF